MSDRYAVVALDDVVPYETEGHARWHTIRRRLDIQAFGMNAWTATDDDQQVIGEHDEADGEQHEEVYVVVSGRAAFTLDGETFDAPAPAVVAIPDPTTRRVAYAKVAGTTIVAMGGERRDEFRTSWQPRHFEGVPTATDAGTAS